MLALNLDKGPENHSHRTQFMARVLAFAQQYHLTVRLASYPPDHSTDTPIERCWGILENHWNGALLDSVQAVLRCAATMPWKGLCPVVALVTPPYPSGVTLPADQMDTLEAQLTRRPHLEKCCVAISWRPAPGRETLFPVRPLIG